MRVRFFLDTSNAPDIDAWLQFALAKGVKWLELDLGTGDGSYRSNCYNFPNICDPIQVLERRLPLPGFTSLETLHLTSVHINGQVLEYVISNCPSLQLLRVEQSDGLIDLNVLKHLELIACLRMRNLAICAPSLLSFVHTGMGPHIKIVVKDISGLVKLHVETSRRTVARQIILYRNCFTHLEELILKTVLFEIAQGPERIGTPICWPSLRKLVFNVLAYDVESLVMHSSWLMNAAPNLQEFRLELSWGEVQGEKRLRSKGERQLPHQCLKTVEIIGFAGGTADVELAMYFLRIGISLERMVIDPHRSFKEEKIFRDFLKGNEKMMARERAKELEAKLSPRTTLFIL